MKFIIITIIIFVFNTFFSCQRLNQLTTNQIYNQYAFLLQESIDYNIQNKKFKYKIQNFISSYEEYNDVMKEFINPFVDTNSRLDPVILSPFFFNSKKDKIIIMILLRERAISGKPVDSVRLILGDKNDDKWIFRGVEDEVTNYRYGNSDPILNDTFISLSMVKKFINRKYMYRNKLEINDTFFDEYW